MYQLAFLIWLEVMYQDMAELCDDTPDCRWFFLNDQNWAISTF